MGMRLWREGGRRVRCIDVSLFLGVMSLMMKSELIYSYI